jgi:hypothetical protein
MGAALTYARRYGLFALVGIAGEDDLDAPDLNAPIVAPATVQTPVPSGFTAGTKSNSKNGHGANAVPRIRSLASTQPILAPDESAKLRDAMIAEIEVLTSPDATTTWANTMLRAKNTLSTEDACFVERAFETRVAGLTPDLASDPAPSEPIQLVSEGSLGAMSDPESAEGSSATVGDRSDLKFPITKTVRRRNKEHLRFVGSQPCLICTKQPSDPHHLRFAQPRALGRKVSDEYTVPLCRAHHRELHRAASEILWWQSHTLAPLAVAESLWRQSQSGQALINPPAPPTRRNRTRRTGDPVNGHDPDNTAVG